MFEHLEIKFSILLNQFEKIEMFIKIVNYIK